MRLLWCLIGLFNVVVLVKGERKCAYVTLCHGESYVVPALKWLRMLNRYSHLPKLILYANMTMTQIRALRDSGATLIEHKNPTSIIKSYKKADMMQRDAHLTSKLDFWLLHSYSRLIVLDLDVLIVDSLDRLCHIPWRHEYQLVASGRVDPHEKISFYEYDRNKAWHEANAWTLTNSSQGLNAGVMVIQPSLKVYQSLLEAYQSAPFRLCCPLQELLFHFYESKGWIVWLNSTIWHARRNVYVEGISKLYHFVGTKPWTEGYRTSLEEKLTEQWQQNT